MARTRLLLTALLLASASAAPLAQQATIRLVSPQRLDTPLGLKTSEVIGIAFQRVGVPHTLVYNPAERAIAGFKAGMFDGDVGRARDFDSVVPGAIRVEPPLMYGEFLAVANAGDPLPKSWADFSRFRFGYLRGARAIESNTRAATMGYPVDSYDACLGMLQLHRLDVCVGLNKILGEAAAAKAAKGEVVTSKFARLGSYIWLGPQHRALAGKLGAVLADMEKQGDLERAFK
jgi:ABC-type amino acid transport substrate-binding protein